MAVLNTTSPQPTPSAPIDIALKSEPSASTRTAGSVGEGCIEEGYADRTRGVIVSARNDGVRHSDRAAGIKNGKGQWVLPGAFPRFWNVVRYFAIKTAFYPKGRPRAIRRTAI